ncbi:hypothetical protein HY483_03230 [Candidatus Woesearchaeota archaeon]|nr:hypothetical protein [Candidatus Woesearchaeota archaeon]
MADYSIDDFVERGENNAVTSFRSRAISSTKLLARFVVESQIGFFLAGELQEKYAESAGCSKYRPMFLSLVDCVILNGAKSFGAYSLLYDNPSDLEVVAGASFGLWAFVPFCEASWRVWYSYNKKRPVGGIIWEFGFRGVRNVLKN